MRKIRNNKLNTLEKRIAALEVEVQQRPDFSESTKQKLRKFLDDDLERLCKEMSLNPS